MTMISTAGGQRIGKPKYSYPEKFCPIFALEGPKGREPFRVWYKTFLGNYIKFTTYLMMSYKTILYTVEQTIATITLNRPQSLNAFTDLMTGEAMDALHQASTDNNVRVIVLTGNGRGFCSGQDVSDIRSRPPDFSIGDHLRHGYHPFIQAMVQCEKPILGAINGVAAGAGCSIALFTDFRVVAEKATFMLAFSKIGLIPDSGINWLLPRLIGYTRAYQMAITAERVSASTALEWGMVNVVTAEETFAEMVQSWAQRAPHAPLASPNAPCSTALSAPCLRRLTWKPIYRKLPARPTISKKGYRHS